MLETLPIDALEVFNAATTLRRYNVFAFEYAQARGLPMTAASDAHHAAALGTAYTILNTDDFSVKGILAQFVQEQRAEPALYQPARQRPEDLEQLDAPPPPQEVAHRRSQVRAPRSLADGF